MKKLSALALLASLFSFTAAAKSIECENLSDEFFEDELTLDTVKKTATYFDNTNYHVLECAFFKSVTLCGNQLFTIKIQNDGEALVFEGMGATPVGIPFACPVK